MNIFRFGLIFMCFALCQSVDISSFDEKLFSEINKLHSQWSKFTSIPENAYTYALRNIPPDITFGSPISGSEILEPINSSALLRTDRREFYPKCSDDIVQILYNLNSGWALKMLDSNGKLMSGLLGGSVTWTGNYRECLDVYSPLDDRDHGDFHGKYCTASMSLNVSGFPNIPLTTGICIPDSCEGSFIRNATANILKLTSRIPVAKDIFSHITVDSVKCKDGKAPLDASAILYLLVVFFLLALVLIGSSITAYKYLTTVEDPSPYKTISEPLPKRSASTEVKSHEVAINDDFPSPELSDATISLTKKLTKNSKVKEFFQCFCAFTNASKILKCDTSANQQLTSVHGVRFLSLTWVIIGHTYINCAADISNKLETLKDLDRFSFQMLMNTPFSVDSFFLLSGLLLGFLFMREMDRRDGKMNWLYFYLHRLWRLTPVYMLLVGFYMLIFKYMGSGPFWHDDYGDSCRHTWWQYLLYINNFIPINEMCIGWSWYLANDMQFYLVSPLFLYPLWRWPKIGFSLIFGLIATNWIVVGILTYQHDIIPMLSGVTEVTDLQAYQDKMWSSFDIIYDKPYCRIAPYLVGVLLGYVLYKNGGATNFLPWWQQCIKWIFATFFSASVIFGLYHVHVTPTISVLYNAFSRTSFVLGLSWLIYACETGHGGIVHKLLSLKIWIPLSRLTYCAYLVHPVLVHGYYMSLQTVLYFTHTTIVIIFLGILIVSYALAFVVSLAFESPMMNLEKMLLKKS